MVYDIFDKSPNLTNMMNCLITRKRLKLDVCQNLVEPYPKDSHVPKSAFCA